MSLKGKLVIVDVKGTPLSKFITETGGTVIKAKDIIFMSNTEAKLEIKAVKSHEFRAKYVECPPGKVMNPATGLCKAEKSKAKNKAAAAKTKKTSKHVYAFEYPFDLYTEERNVPNHYTHLAAEQLQKEVDGEMDDMEGGLAKYVQLPGVKSIIAKVDTDKYNIDFTVVADKKLTDKALKELQDALSGQMTDGWGEGLKQRFDDHKHMLSYEGDEVKLVKYTKDS